MYVCYIDESGVPDIPGNTSHFVLAGISIPIWNWRAADNDVAAVMKKYGLQNAEFHTAWILRTYFEQSRVANFDKLSWADRRTAVERERNIYLLHLQSTKKNKTYQQVKKNYRHTNAYSHLTQAERRSLVYEVADRVSSWGFARLFAECIDKTHFNPAKSLHSIDEQAFEQLVSRFEQYLRNSEAPVKGPASSKPKAKNYGLLVHDNNDTVALKHTRMMRHFHNKGTLWTRVDRIIDTPLFVNSTLTSMVQIADLCSYGLRRYLENGETDIFKRLFARADRSGGVVVGIRHYSNLSCKCEICAAHKIKATPMTVAASKLPPTNS